MDNVQLVSLQHALSAFTAALQTQNQEHIRPLHQHLAERLVFEGGFLPNQVRPTPPLRVEVVGAGQNRRYRLHGDSSFAGRGDQTILGGLKTKSVDVVVSSPEVGPCLAISVKGTMNAFRNLTNRMEEAAGDCTNLHIAYPTLVYGFLHILRATWAAPEIKTGDTAILATGEVTSGIKRYHDAMSRITDRADVRNDVSRYEAIALALVRVDDGHIGEVWANYPSGDSSLGFAHFFEKLYRVYDLRYVYAAPALASATMRREWAHDSPILDAAKAAGFECRIADD
jgi:hypothetical protein